jgi:hypothetical protein
VGDFNKDGNLDLFVADNQAAGNVDLFLGNGLGGFTPAGTFATVDNPTSLAVADLNRDGFPDVIVTSSSTTPSSGNIGVLLNDFGTGFSNTIPTSIFNGVSLTNVIVTDVNADSFPDLVVAVSQQIDPSTGTAQTAVDNLFTLLGNGDGTFQDPVPYQVGAVSGSIPSFVASLSDPLIRATTFSTGGTVVSTNLIRNGDFEARDLSGEKGNLDGWQTFDQANSHGQWSPQAGTTSPLSLVSVSTPPQGTYAAMLDEADLNPSGSQAQNSDYAGSHALYEDIVIPSTATKVALTLSLSYVNRGTLWSDTNVTPSLDYNTSADNQQIRVDIIDPTVLNSSDPNAALDVDSSVLKNLFITDPMKALSAAYFTITADLSAYAGKTIRLRIASANNRGKLIVGVDNVSIRAVYQDNKLPTITNLGLRNPGFGLSPSFGGSTTDPTLVGQVVDDGLSPPNAGSPPLGSPNNIAFVALDMNNDGDFNGPEDLKTTRWDALGNFSFTLSNLLPGMFTIGIEAVDKAGNSFITSETFTYQGPSAGTWQAEGPGPIRTSGTGVQYPTVSGRITSVVVDPRDQTGNTYYVGSDNGGVWRTRDGGNDWTPLTDFVTDANGNPVPVSIGGLAIFNQTGTLNATIYAGTGVADTSFNSRAGIGVLKSTDNGATWTVVGASALAGARISKMAVDPNNSLRVYAAVASGGSFGPGLYRSDDGGVTWINTLNPTKMNLAAGGNLGAGFALASVTDVVVDPFNPEDIYVGLGNIGLVASSSSAGVWRSPNHGGTWSQIVGGVNAASLGIPNDTLPFGTTVGRVTLALGTGRATDQSYVYVLMGTPPPSTSSQGVIDTGTFLGLFKSKNGGDDWTHIKLRQDAGGTAENYQDINLLGHDASSVGALLVDPTNPNVVYVGGTRNGQQPGDNPTLLHGFLRVDTRNMRDTTYVDPTTSSIPNDGDDISAALAAEINSNKFPDGTAYTPVGVLWNDLERNTTKRSSSTSRVPTGVDAFAMDQEGRLLIGTQAGLWRGVSFGFTAARGAFGVGRGNGPGMVITTLNGNLQIADLTSIAVDPTNGSTLYSGQVYTGTALTTGSLTWSTSGFTNLPNPPTDGYGQIATAGFIRVGPADPNADPGTPTTVYRTWMFADPINGLGLEVSNSGGAIGTFATANAGIRTATDKASLFPVLAVNPVNVVESGVTQNELMYGTDKVYESDTSAAFWDIVSNVLSSTGRITAMAFGPSGVDAFYVGDNLGEVFVDLNNGSDGFPLRTTGLPSGISINGITVDPNNPSIAYVMIGGKGKGHVFRTTNAGVSWTNISSNLPDVPAYSLVVDPRYGKIYVGTDVGVYVSTNTGASWTRLGQGLPNVPVVDLQFNPATEVLAAATQGRSAFVISTDVLGPRVVTISPPTPVLPAITQVTVTFNETIDPRTFTPDNDVAARRQIVNAIDHSNEYRTILVTSYYQRFLHTPTASEVSPWVTYLATHTDEQLIATLVGSAEYFSNASKGNNDTTTWVNAIYNDLLGRPPTSPELSLALANLSTNTTSTRATVALDVLRTPDYRTVLLNTFYAQVLKRLPTAVELNTGLTAFARGASDEDVLTGLVASVEYYRKIGTSTFVDANFNTPALDPGARPSAVAFGDLNGDSLPDLVVADPGTNTLTIFAGKAGGGFAPNPTVLDLPAGASPTALAVGDFFNTKQMDIAVANTGLGSATSNSISLFVNTNSTPGVFSFASRMEFDGGNNPVAIVADDIDGNGIIDLAAVDSVVDGSGKYDVAILTGTGGPDRFSSVTTFVDTGFTVAPTGLAAGNLHVNGPVNNYLDLAISSAGGVNVLLNDTSTGLFVGKVPDSLTTIATTSVAIGPIDTDNIPDVAASSTLGGGEVLVFQNSGGSTPTFSSTPTIFAAGLAPTGITLQDLNGDGLNDILVVNNITPGDLSVLKNTTVHATSGSDTVTFAPVISYPVGNNPLGLALGDTNQDGVLDVATANSATDDVSVLLGFSDGSFQTATDATFVNQAYRDLLHRTVDAPSLNSFLATMAVAEQIRLIGPRGTTAPLTITPDPNSNDSVFQLTFAPQTPDGTYTLMIGPNGLGVNIKDLAGNTQDQNQNLVQGENPADRFTGLLAINTSDDGRFITGMYHDLLGRAADTVGFVNLLGPVDAARNQALQGIAGAFVGSDENLVNFIRRLYDGSDPGALGSYLLPLTNLLDRSTPVSQAEVNSWIQYLRAGHKEEDLINLLVSSPEYFNNPNKGNGSNATWVNSIWKDLLGRPATDPFAAFLVSRLNAGTMIRTQAAAILLNSDEYRARLIRGTYQAALGRIAQTGDINSWLPLLRLPSPGPGNLSPDQQFVAIIFGSGEFFYRLGNTNSTWLRYLYSTLLGRSPDTPGFNSWLSTLLNSYVLQRQFASHVLNTTFEYRARLVTQYFQTYLRRSPSQAEINIFVVNLQNGLRDEQVIAAIVASPEYFQGQASQDNTQYVDHLYNDILLRNADSGAQTFIDFLNSLPASQQLAGRQNVALALLASVEYRRNLIAGFFDTYLGRNKPIPVPLTPSDPDPELDPWVNLLAQGASDEGVLDQVLGTQEYFNRTKPPLLFP